VGAEPGARCAEVRRGARPAIDGIVVQSPSCQSPAPAAACRLTARCP